MTAMIGISAATGTQAILTGTPTGKYKKAAQETVQSFLQ